MTFLRDTNTSGSTRSPHVTSVVVKVAVTLLLLILLIAKIDLGALAARFMTLSPGAIVLLIAIAISQMFMLAYRWCLVSRLVALPLQLREAIRCVLASQFFSQGLPASVGGDVLRVWWLTRIGFRFGHATQSVLLDRLAGLLSLLFLNLSAVPLLAWMMGRPEAATWLGATLFVCFILIIPASSRPARRLAIYLMRLGRGHHRLVVTIRWGTIIQRAIGRLFLLRRGWAVLLGGILIHLVTILLCFLVAKDAGIPLTFAGLSAVVPGVLLISYLPISIGGWGIREGGMAVGLGLLGIAPTDAVFVGLALGALGLATAGIGALIWLLTPMPVNLKGQIR